MGDVEGLRTHADALFTRAGGIYPPSSVILSWPAPNYQDPQTHDWTGTVMIIVFLAITFAVYIARVWARVVLAKNAGLDDLLMSIAMLPLIGVTISVGLACRVYGFQWHAWDQTAKTLVTSRSITMAIEIHYMLSTALIKISILCFYRRITAGLTLTFVYWVWASIVFVICYGIAFTVAIIFTCSPVEGFWRLFDIAWRLQNELRCHNEGAVIVAVCVISTLQDFFICALPVFLVWNLQIPRRQKAALIGIFGMGVLTCVCGVMRTYYAIYVYYSTFDITWYAYYGWIWTALEADLGVICASAPALKVFFRRYFNQNTNRSGASGSSERKTPRFGKGSPGNSFGVSNSLMATDVQTGTWETDPMPMDRIKVSTGMALTVEDRDDAISQASNSSTRNLTALPVHVRKGSAASQWTEGCKSIVTALRPEPQRNSRDKDIERGAIRD